MDKPKPYGPPPLEATYADLSTTIAAIQEHTKGNRYTLFKHDTKPSRIIFSCDRYRKPQARPKNTDIHESKRRTGSRSKKYNYQMKVALKLDKVTQQ